MGGNGVNFNAPKDTTGVNRVNTQNILRAAGQGALKGGINCIFTHGKDSTGNVGGKVDSYAGKITHTDYENGQPVGQNGEEVEPQGENQEESWLTGTVNHWYGPDYDYRKDPFVISGENPYPRHLEANLDTGEIKVVYDNDEYNNK